MTEQKKFTCEGEAIYCEGCLQGNIHEALSQRDSEWRALLKGIIQKMEEDKENDNTDEYMSGHDMGLAEAQGMIEELLE